MKIHEIAEMLKPFNESDNIVMDGHESFEIERKNDERSHGEFVAGGETSAEKLEKAEDKIMELGKDLKTVSSILVDAIAEKDWPKVEKALERCDEN